MFKKLICILSTLVILMSISILPVFAEDATESEETFVVNQWTWKDWDTYFSDVDLTKYDFDYLRDVSYDYTLLCFNKNDISSNLCGLLGYFINADTLTYTDKIMYADNCTKYSTSRFVNSSLIDNNVSYNSSIGKYVFNIGMQYSSTINLVNNSYIWIISDYDVYKSFSTAYPDFKEQIFYCDNPIQSFLNYFDGKNVDLNPVVAPEGFNKTAIKYSSSFDSPYGKYLIKPYEDEQENLITAGLFSDLDIYYDSYFNRGSSYDHSETIEFYIDVSDVFVEDFGYTLFDYYNYKWDLPDMTDFFDKHFKVVHYEKDYFSALDFFKLSDSNIKNFNDVLSIEKIEDSFFIKFTLLSEYSVAYNVGVEPGTSNITNSILSFLGNKITHTCKRIGTLVGDDDNKGFGSDISQADDSLSRPPTKEELKDWGFDYGYPNTQGSYPYKLTIYRNGSEYFQMYFSKMPSVASTYYTDKCIDYGVNVSNMKVYMYFKEQNMSKFFDFTANNSDVYNNVLVTPGGFYDEVMFKPIDDFTGRLLNALLGVNVSEFNNTYTLHFWTNYTGTFENMNGFYCKFNWDLESSGHFQKNNSDDDYDYTNDYVPDESFTDNNGNIHGGAVETPTESPDYNGFNNGDFKFDENTLWDYANSFLGFCARAFKVLPNFIWQLIGCSIVIVIILRITGR